jgi:hypothetical protein
MLFRGVPWRAESEMRAQARSRGLAGEVSGTLVARRRILSVCRCGRRRAGQLNRKGQD